MLAIRVSRLALLAFLPNIVFPYNIDTSQPIVYEDPDSSGSNYFGYSVSLSPGKNGASSRSLFVGAPQFSNGTGRVYRCFDPSTRGPKTSQCTALMVDGSRGPKPGWLGASMATSKSSDFTVCAPRTLSSDRFMSPLRGLVNINLLKGACYYIGSTEDKLHHLIVDQIPSGSSSSYGWSVSYATRNYSISYPRIIGQPGSDYINIQRHMFKPSYLLTPVKSSTLGYSVTSGSFAGPRWLVYVAGEPSYLLRGRVVVFWLSNSGHLVDQKREIHGSVFGEYFGASLTTGDFDGDGRDDLAVGAPHWGDIDFGRVYIYHGKFDGNFQRSQTLQGKADRGRFGYTLASDDLDRDGYSDLIVSAPWENSGQGAIYVYYGRQDFREEDPSVQVIQRIEPSMFGHVYQIQRFGFSLSQPIDIDGNGYPDLAIGAYKSGHAVVLRSRPVIETNVTLITYPVILQASTENFIVSLCVTYKGEGAPASQDLSFNMMVDGRHNRVENSSLEFDAVFFRDSQHCLNQTISLMKSRDHGVLDPLEISVTHGIKKGMNDNGIDAVLNRTSLIEKEPMAVSFNKGCEGGVCNAKLFVDASFEGVGKNNVWVVGSGDISLNLVVRTEDQLAYETRITIAMPPGIRLRKTIEFCTVVMDPLSLACDVGNPLVRGIPKRFKVDLDMSEIETRLVNATVLIFNVTKRTQSVDKEVGNSTTILELKTKHQADVSLAGVTETGYIDYGRIAEKSKVSVRHAYQVLKFGPSRIMEAYLNIDVPVFIVGRKDSFLNITDPKLMDDSGKTYDCSIDDSRTRREIYDDADDLGPNTSKPGKISADLMTERTVDLNCSTEVVSCLRISCGFELSRTNEDVRYVVLDMTLNAGAFYSSDEDSLTVKFHTNASLDIRSPVISESSTSLKWSASVVTMLYNKPEPKRVPVWVIPFSMFLGILLLCVLVVILSRVGFFNRSRKLEAARTKDQKLLLHIEDQEVEDEDD